MTLRRIALLWRQRQRLGSDKQRELEMVATARGRRNPTQSLVDYIHQDVRVALKALDREVSDLRVSYSSLQQGTTQL